MNVMMAPPAATIHLGDFTAICGAVIAFLALLIGVATLVGAARTARLQHMHMLFKDYLRMQFDYNAHIGSGNREGRRLRGNLGGFKMYTFEEMVLWLRRERRLSRLYFWSRHHRDHVDSWEATVRWHLDRCSPQDLIDFDQPDINACYGPDIKSEVRDSRARIPTEARMLPASSHDVSAEFPDAPPAETTR